jgi:multiple sugar transport system permease protein
MPAVESRKYKLINGIIIVLLFAVTLIYLIPLYWICCTAFKSRLDAATVPPTVFFKPTAAPFVKLITKRAQRRDVVTEEQYEKATWYEKIIYDEGEKIITKSQYLNRFLNSIVIASASTLLALGLGTLAAYGFSRFKMAGKNDWLFFILSTRMLPPVVVAIPIFLMYRKIGIYDTYTGMIFLYTALNLSLEVWLMKGFIDEIPKEYEEAAMVDGYTRFEVFWKIVLPQLPTGIAATAVFAFITVWNEYALALMLTSKKAQTAVPFIPSQIGSGFTDWPTIAAGTLVLLMPVAFFTFFLRNHLLRGVTFGTIRR